MPKLASEIFRDFVVANVPSTGPNQPVPADIRDWGGQLEADILALQTNGIPLTDLVFSTKAEIDASLGYDANSGAKVVADPNPALNGIYKKAGASGSGSWTRISALTDSVVDIRGNVILSGGSATGPLERCIIAGSGALSLNTTGSDVVAIGHNSLRDFTGNASVAIGSGALMVATGSANVAGGTGAGNAITTGWANTILGHSAAAQGSPQAPNVTNSIVLGAGAYSTNSFQFALPDDVDSIRAFGMQFMRAKLATRSLYMGELAGNLAATGGAMVGIGAVTLSNVTTGGGLTAIGDLAQQYAITSFNTTAVGSAAAQFGTALTDCTYIGADSGKYVLTGVGDSVVGFRSLKHATVARNNCTLGDSALWIYQGTGTIALGYRVAEHLEGGNYNIILGTNAANAHKTGSENVLLGYNANAMTSITVTRDEIAGTATGSVNAGSGQTGAGHHVLLNARSGKNTAVGWYAGASLVGSLATDGDNVFVGESSGYHASQLTTAVNSIAIGANSFTTASNQVSIGNASILETILSGDIILNRDAAAPAARMLRGQDVATGTSNVAGGELTIAAGRGTGTGAGGSILFKIAPGGASGSAKNAYMTALTINRFGAATFGAGVNVETDSYLFFEGRSGLGSPADGHFFFRNNAASAFATMKLTTGLVTIDKALACAPGASVTPVSNGDVTFQLTSNTQITFKAKGSDGTVRSGSITLS